MNMKPSCNVMKQLYPKVTTPRNFLIYKFIIKILGEYTIHLMNYLVNVNLKYPKYFVLWNIVYLILGAYFCHKSRKNGDVCIFVQQNLHYTPTDLEESCLDQEIEVFAIKLHHSTNNICILMI
jgi:hypothetical protein